MLLPDGPTWGAANRLSEQAERLQHVLDEGPSVSAARSRGPVRLRALDDTLRWPRFAAESTSLSLRAVVAVPLLAGSRVIGVLSVYSQRDDGLESLDTGAALRLAARVQPAVSNARTLCVASLNARLLRRAAQQEDDG